MKKLKGVAAVTGLSQPAQSLRTVKKMAADNSAHITNPTGLAMSKGILSWPVRDLLAPADTATRNSTRSSCRQKIAYTRHVFHPPKNAENKRLSMVRCKGVHWAYQSIQLQHSKENMHQQEGLLLALSIFGPHVTSNFAVQSPPKLAVAGYRHA